MNADRAVVFLFVLAAIALVVGIAGTWRTLSRTRWAPRRFFDFVALVGALLSASVGLTIIYGALQLKQNMRGALDFTGKPLPAFRYRIGAAEHSNSEWQGKPVLLNLWATWCVPCRAELETLSRLPASNLQIVALSDEDPKTIAAHLEKNPYKLAIGHSAAGWLQQIPVRPLTLIVDRDGIVKETRAGALDPAELEKLIAPYR